MKAETSRRSLFKNVAGAGLLWTAGQSARAQQGRVPRMKIIKVEPILTGGDVVKPYPKVEKGFALPPEGPGLGVTFDEERARAKPFRKPGLQPRLNAPDGSVRDF